MRVIANFLAMNLNNEQIKVLKSIGKAETTGNVMDILGWSSNRFDEGFQFANELQNLDLVKLLYSNFNKNLIVVELTLWGEQKGSNTGGSN